MDIKAITAKSWKTSLFGYAILILTWLQQVFISQSIPQNSKDWIEFLIKNGVGLAAVFAKDWDVTNSPASVSVTAHVISDIAQAKPDVTVTNISTTPVIK